MAYAVAVAPAPNNFFFFSLIPAKRERLGDAFEAAIKLSNRKLGLDGQPRAIVFHEKEGRRHASCGRGSIASR